MNANKDYLHGMTLEKILTYLIQELGWEDLGHSVRIKCFTTNPSIASSLNFLRRTPWARKQVEELYKDLVQEAERKTIFEDRVKAIKEGSIDSDKAP